MWKNIVEPGRSQMAIWRLRIARWVPKATNTHSGCVILTAFLLQQWLHERASILRHKYVACVVAHHIEEVLHCEILLIRVDLVTAFLNLRFI
jgi:hypothetical protein